MSCWKLHILLLVCLSWQLPVMNTLVRKALVRNVLVMNTLVRKAVHDQEVVQKWVSILLKQGPALSPGCNYPVPLQLVLSLCCHWLLHGFTIPQWGTADAEIKVPSAENPELSKVLFNAWDWSQHSTYLCILSCNSVFPSSAFQVHFNFFYSVVKWPMLWSESGTFACDVLHCVPPLDDLHGWQGTKHQEPINHGFTRVII